ncbi:hypothetical protein [Lysinibacter sp. HNR]|uniref:hypothetical protein n=1 Tax=Lysinibacter sp. HNR TaxID=3031408 RepID=UPI002434F2D7|nr:hypothetical protein [Lysinibacter sp. HNR]WGD37523.1 hypothetical protein FrondiHNR_00950 [Lysinibacter sp. HNR]
MRLLRRSIVCVVLGGLFFTTGCTTSLVEESFLGTPENAPADPLSPNGAPDILVLWQEDKTKLSLTVWGSSSCANFPSAIDWNTGSSNRVNITLEAPADEVCTADFAPKTYIVAVPQRAQGASVDVTVTGPQKGDRFTTVLS